jgi:hypothetical protein
LRPRARSTQAVVSWGGLPRRCRTRLRRANTD